MTKENRQFIQAMRIILRKDILPWVILIGGYTAFVWYLNANKDTVNIENKSVTSSIFSKNKTNLNLFNPFEAKTR